MVSQWFGTAAAVLSTAAFIPQLLKTWKTKKAEDVSYALLVAFCSGCFCWVIYGYLIQAYAVLIANTITLSLNLAILGLKLSFDKAKSAKAASESSTSQ